MGSSVVLATAGYDHTIRCEGYSRARVTRDIGRVIIHNLVLYTPRFWEATSGICYRTLQFADSQVNREARERRCCSHSLDRGALFPECPCVKAISRCLVDSCFELPTPTLLPLQVNKLEITADKTLIAAAGNPHVRLYSINSANPQPVTSFDQHTGNVTAVGFQKDGKWMYTGSEDGTIRIWDLRAPGCQREYESRAAVNTVALHPHQGELISGDQHGNIRVWDLTANACSCELVPELNVGVRSLSVAGDGSLMVAANSSGTCYVWRALRHGSHATHFEPLHKLKAHSSYVLKCTISPDVRQLATAAADKTVKLWNLDGFVLDRALTGHGRWVWDAAFSVDAAYLVTASTDCTARLWDLSTGEAIRIYSGHHKGVVTCALNDSAADAREPEAPPGAE